MGEEYTCRCKICSTPILVHWCKNCMKGMLEGTHKVPQHEDVVAKHGNRLLKQILDCGTIGHSKLLQKNAFHLNAEELKLCINTLVVMGYIERLTQGKRTFYRPIR